MARHGENIRKRKDGRWEGRYLAYCPEKKLKVYRSVYGHSYKEVKEKLEYRKNSAGVPESGEPVMGKRRDGLQIRFSDAAVCWLQQVKEGAKASTYLKYSTVYHRHIEGIIGDTPLSNVTQDFVSAGISDPLSESMSKSVYCVLNQILKYASTRYNLSLPLLKRPISSSRSKPVRTFTTSEQAKLLSILYHEKTVYKNAVLFCLFTGLRLGEVCALKWADLDFTQGTVTVSRTVQRLPAEDGGEKTALVELEPKSGYSKREIPLPRELAGFLTQLQNEKTYVFGGDRPLDPRTLQYQFKKILKEAKVAYKNFHALRHTFATNCIGKGVDVKSLSELLGHSQVQITLNRYVHPSMDTKRRHMEALCGFYGQILGQVS